MSLNPPSAKLDPVIHQPVRTRIMAYLVARGSASFSDLKNILDITDGNLEAHIKKLAQAGYLEKFKSRGQGRPQTLYSLSSEGKEAFENYLSTLKTVLLF